MRAIISGGTGLIGRALAHSLVQDGHEVVILTRKPRSVRGMPPEVQVQAWDGRSGEGWQEIADGADVIINLAGESLSGETFFPAHWTPERKTRILESRRNAGQAINEAVRDASKKPAVLIQASAIGYYGPRGDEELTETSLPGGDFLARVCMEWEAATAAVESAGVRRVVLRTGLVLSKHGGVLSRLALPFRLFVGGALGSGDQWYSWIHSDDYVSAVRFLIDNDNASGAYNLTAPEPVTNKEFSRVLGRVMKRPAFMRVPSFVFYTAFGEVATIVVNGQKVLPQRLLDLGFQFRFATLEPALADLL